MQRVCTIKTRKESVFIFKMLKDVDGSANKCSIHSAKQRMTACNNNSMCNYPSPYILGYACYYFCMPVLLQGCFL